MAAFPDRSGKSLAPPPATAQVFLFDAFRFNTRTGELWHDGVQTALTPRATAVLALLADKAPQTVTKQELFDVVWNGRIAGDEALTSCIQELRKALGDNARHPRLIETRHRRGYRLMVPVARPGTPLEGRPAIAILPFDNLTTDPEQKYFADGLVEDITGALGRIGSVLVVDRSAAGFLAGQTSSVQQIGRELKVRYVLRGTVRRAGDKLRLTAKLIETATTYQLWSETYDGRVADVFDLQDTIVERIVGALGTNIWAAEIERARTKRPDSLQAYDYVLRGYPGFRALEDPAHSQAMEMFRQALELEPTYALAMALLAWCHSHRFSRMMSGDPDFHRARAIELANKALDLDPDAPRVMSAAGTALMLAGTYADLDHCLHLFEKALAIDPNSSQGWLRMGLVRVNRSEPEEAIQAFERTLRLSPMIPQGAYARWGIGLAHFVAGRLPEAAACFRQALAERPRDAAFRRRLCSTLGLLGELDEARSLATGLMTEFPGQRLDRLASVSQFQPEPARRYVEGLKKAGYV
jgi:adenylate cyclase